MESQPCNIAAATIAAKNYLSSGRVLADSFRRHHPGIPFFLLLADEVDGCFVPESEPFQMLRLQDLALPDLAHLRFRYSQQEFSYALTPSLLRHLLDRGFGAVVFLKQESLVVGDLSEAFRRLGQCSVLLTPHLLAPLEGPVAVGRELNILLSGTYNNGFLGVSDTPASRQFLEWWRDRLSFHCIRDVREGLHFEQHWLDLAPGLFEGVAVSRDPGLNVAHWNLPERDVTLAGDTVSAGGSPCSLFRFSGFDPENPDMATRYSRRLTMANAGPAAEVFRRYLALLKEADYENTRHWPYAYDRFDNGAPVIGLMREIYRNLGEQAAQFGDPFVTGPAGSYFRWLNGPADDHPDPRARVTRLWRAVYDERPDVRKAFPDILRADRRRFLRWTARFGATEHGIPDHFLAGARPEGTQGHE